MRASSFLHPVPAGHRTSDLRLARAIHQASPRRDRPMIAVNCVAAGLYHAHKVSFGAAAALAGLGYEEFHFRLEEHFGHGFVIADETVEEDLRLVDALSDPRA